MTEPITILGTTVEVEEFSPDLSWWLFCNDYVAVNVYSDGEWRVTVQECEYTDVDGHTEKLAGDATPQQVADRATAAFVAHMKALLASLPDGVRREVVGG